MMNIRICKALFMKDLKNCFVNKNVFLMLALPVLFGVMYKFLLGDILKGATGSFVIVMCIIMTISIVPLNVLANMVAEEKEKHTLRSLMLANVSATDFLLSKAFVALVLMLIDGILIFLVCQEPMEYFGYFLIFYVLSSLSVLFFGALVGLLSKDQMSAGTLSSPLMILLMLPPMFSQLNEMIEKIAVIFPTTSFQMLYLQLSVQQPFFNQETVIAIIVCIVWILLGVIAFMYGYKKKGLDD